jgi:hypothetical protein
MYVDAFPLFIYFRVDGKMRKNDNKSSVQLFLSLAFLSCWLTPVTDCPHSSLPLNAIVLLRSFARSLSLSFEKKRERKKFII